MTSEKPLFFVCLPILTLLFHSCQLGNRTVNQRIDKNPVLFNTKSIATKRLITRGALAPGMTRDEVYLALGNPKLRSEGIENGKAYEEWAYQKLKPTVDFDIGIGGAGLAGPKLGLDRTTSHTVRFVNGRVSGYRSQK